MSRLRTLGLFLLVVLVFGSALPAVKTGLADMPPLLFAAARSYLAATVLFVYVGLSGRGYLRPRGRADWVAVLAGGVFLIGGTGLGFVAQQYITAGVAAIIFSLTPVVTAVLAWVLLPEERLSRRDYAGVLLGFVGIAVVISPDPASLLDPAVVGKSLFLVAVVVVALGTVLIRRSGSGMPVISLTAWAMLLGGTVHLGFAAGVGESLASVDLTPLALGMVVYLGLVVGAVGLVLFLLLMGEVGALKANLTTYLTPLVALAIGWLLLEEAIQPVAILGFVIILAGFAVLESRELWAHLARYRSLFR